MRYSNLSVILPVVEDDHGGDEDGDGELGREL